MRSTGEGGLLPHPHPTEGEGGRPRPDEGVLLFALRPLVPRLACPAVLCLFVPWAACLPMLRSLLVPRRTSAPPCSCSFAPKGRIGLWPRVQRCPRPKDDRMLPRAHASPPKADEHSPWTREHNPRSPGGAMDARHGWSESSSETRGTDAHTSASPEGAKEFRRCDAGGFPAPRTPPGRERGGARLPRAALGRGLPRVRPWPTSGAASRLRGWAHRPDGTTDARHGWSETSSATRGTDAHTSASPEGAQDCIRTGAAMQGAFRPPHPPGRERGARTRHGLLNDDSTFHTRDRSRSHPWDTHRSCIDVERA